MEKHLRQVRPEDFDAELLLAAAREGRLYVDASIRAVSQEEVIREIRAYVGRINGFVTRGYLSKVETIWQRILSTDELIAFLMPGSKARKCREFNKYGVVRIIGVLREHGVYEHRSDRDFNALLEPGTRDSPYRSYLGMGIEQRELLLEIRQILVELKL